MKIDKTKLEQALADKYIMKQVHPDGDLWIYNYTQTTQYESVWNDITMQCRGLILDKDYNIVARPFKKFFNMSEHEQDRLPDFPKDLSYKYYDKLDGSLGILYWKNDKPYIASRGSFTSEQSIEATKMLNSHLSCHVADAVLLENNKDKTFIFEIIYPSNRIVVDYGNTRKLVLLGVVGIEDGVDYEIDAIETDFTKAKTYQNFTSFENAKELDLENKEGFVVRFENGFRMKLKFDDYCRLHRIITNVSSYDIWECLRHNTGFEEILSTVPDEFYDWVKDCETTLKLKFSLIYESYTNINSGLSKIETDKQFAEIAKKYDNPGLLFSLRNGKCINDAIWKMIKPKYEKPFTNRK